LNVVFFQNSYTFVDQDAEEEEHKQMRLKAKSIRDEAESIKQRRLQTMQSSHLAVDKMRAEEARAKKGFSDQMQQMNGVIIDAIDKLTGHKQYIQQRLRELAELAELTSKEVSATENSWTRLKAQLA
jgi:N12 class adenine-specific DNA methylase